MNLKLKYIRHEKDETIKVKNKGEIVCKFPFTASQTSDWYTKITSCVRYKCYS